ncbi:hypothetical protein P43SY_008630 [Pythium insidiosum]|uniref:HSF-type DNA-binding domain-containing protein n=1 Tax=Pythium insidiosum TaxID=114742 RepID=A0AAD5Q4U5_PYTIN|nr:hypothetical protein P43SY_008630 [Pythium insidiosum]
MMAEHCLPKYFRHRRFSSLIRQLNFYSFYRVQEGQLTIYQHSYFRKGRPDLLVHIKRRGAGKAKDPWFDPLAPPTPKPTTMPLSLNGLMMPPQMDMCQSMGAPNPMVCYSPMAKPLANSIDNMSPALKPMITPMAPPAVDLGGGSTMLDGEKYLENQRWDNQLLDMNMARVGMNSVMKTEPQVYAEFAVNSPLLGSSNMSKCMSNSVDIDIQDFLTDDCSMLGEKNGSAEDRVSPSHCHPSAPTKCALVARNCLKWENKECAVDESPVYDRSRPDVPQTEADATFEQELLLDLANVEPGAWEVPLSPLNDEEDVMPWLDLCF